MRTLLAGMVLLFSSVILHAQQGAVKPSAKLEASTITAEENRASQWQTDYGSYRRTQNRRRNVDIRVTNFSHASVPYKLRVYFVATLPPQHERYIFSVGEIDSPLVSGANIRFKAESTLLEQQETRYITLGEHHYVGGDIEGWIVQLLCGGNVIEQAASTHALEELARDNVEIAKLVDTYRSDLSKHYPDIGPAKMTQLLLSGH